MAPRESPVVHLDPAEHASPGDVELALAALLDPARPLETRQNAAKLLANLGDPRVVVPLAVAYAECARSASSLEHVLAWALERLGAVRTLTRELTSASPALRLRAARVLGMLRDPRALPALVAALDDAHPRVREQVASALHGLADPRALPALARLLATDPDADVRGAAAQALGQIGTDEAAVVLERAAARETDSFVIILVERARAKLGRGPARPHLRAAG